MKTINKTITADGKSVKLIINFYDLKKDRKITGLKELPKPWEKTSFPYHGITESKKFLLKSIQLIINKKVISVHSEATSHIFISDFVFKPIINSDYGNILFITNKNYTIIRFILSDGFEELNWYIDEKGQVDFFSVVDFP